VAREVLKWECSAPAWRDLRRALVRLELLGQVRRGFFVQDLSGEQYAYPQAVEGLRAAKLRTPEDNGQNVETGTPLSPEPMLTLNVCDPANPFGALFALTDPLGEEVKFLRVPQKYLVVRGGQPVLLYEGKIRLLLDLSPAEAERAVRALMQLVDRPAPVAGYTELPVRDWNGHPIDVSPARHLLLKLGFVSTGNRWRGFVYDGLQVPDPEEVAQAEREMPARFEHAGKEKAPVRYDAGWIVSRSHEDIRDKVRGLIAFLERTLPAECEFVYRPRQLLVRYRGLRCMHPYIQRKQIYLQITHKGWTRGIPIGPDTDLEGREFRTEFEERFARTREQIDALLDS
jgi:ATP-dependent Lhr-like helicase